MKLEFEKKILINQKYNPLIDPELKKYTPKLELIYTCYDKNFRYRGFLSNGKYHYIKEHKKSIKLDASYSLCSEEEFEITEKQFFKKLNKAEKYTVKLRNTYNEVLSSKDSVLLFDSYINLQKENIVLLSTLSNINFNLNSFENFYLNIVEIEFILTNNTKSLSLIFNIPKFLSPHVYSILDNRDKFSKNFNASNLTPTEENINNITKILKDLER